MGITGDLAKRKILPSVAQFAEINQSKFNIELIGYSRSTANHTEIKQTLDQSSSNNTHKLKNLYFVEGQYDDAEKLDIIFSDLEQNDRLIIYLAIPPAVFIPFLSKACPLNPANIDIIIEKPFGQSLEEAQEIILKSHSCTLTHRIQFFDHYAFKASSLISKFALAHTAEYIMHPINRIEIKALESVNARGREGYYKNVGALKDMFQHLVTMYQLAHTLFDIPLLRTENLVINDLQLGQYNHFKEDINDENCTTDTYFKLSANSSNQINISMESGKSLGTKSTSIDLYCTDETKITWNLDPDKHICVTKNDLEVLSFSLIDSNILDHTRMLTAIVADDYSRFVSHGEVYNAWNLYDMIVAYKDQNAVEPIIYENALYPIQSFT